jgi:hypothetical protein
MVPRHAVNAQAEGGLALGFFLVSMDGRGRVFDNIFVERLWRSLKYEQVHLHEYRSVTTPGEGSAITSPFTMNNDPTAALKMCRLRRYIKEP